MTASADGEFWFTAAFLEKMLREGGIFRPRATFRQPTIEALDYLADDLNAYAMLMDMSLKKSKPHIEILQKSGDALNSAAAALADLKALIDTQAKSVTLPGFRTELDAKSQALSAMVTQINSWKESDAFAPPNITAEESNAHTRHIHKILKDAFCKAMRSTNKSGEFVEPATLFISKVLPLMTGGRLHPPPGSVGASFKAKLPKSPRLR
jgi:hypothetical protein